MDIRAMTFDPKQIWKYPLQLQSEQILALSPQAQILSVQEQDGQLVLWALVDAETAPRLERRRIRIFGTGMSGVFEGLRYLQTVQLESMVWHVFDGGPA